MAVSWKERYASTPAGNHMTQLDGSTQSCNLQAEIPLELTFMPDFKFIIFPLSNCYTGTLV